MNWQQKVWGRTRLVMESCRVQRHELEVEAGGYCSWHFHEHRENYFVVLTGKIAVLELFGWKYKYRQLSAGDTMYVPANVVHQFQVIESGTVQEEYWPSAHRGTISIDDIVRLSIGGKLDAGETFDDMLAQGYPILEPLCLT